MNQENYNNPPPQQYNPPPDPWGQMEEDSIDIREIFYKYFLRFWYLYLLFPVMAYVAAKVYLRYQVPIYNVEATILIRGGEENSNNLSEEAVLAELGIQKDNRNLENEMLIMKSRALMEEVARELKLEKSFYAIGRVKSTEFYKNGPVEIDSMILDESAYGQRFQIGFIGTDSIRLYNANFDKNYAFNDFVITPFGFIRFVLLDNTPSLPPNGLFLQFRNPKSIARSLSGGVQTDVLGGTSAIRLRMRTPTVAKAKDILNTLIDKYNKSVIENKNTVGKNTLDFIDERINELTKELSSVELQVEGFKTERQIIGQDLSSFASLYEEVKTKEEQIALLQTERALIKSLQEYLQNSENIYQTVPTNLIQADASINEVITQLNELIFQRQELAKGATGSNPQLISLDDRIRFQRQNLLQNLIITLQEYDKRIPAEQDKYQSIIDNIEGVPRQERQLTEIMRQQAIKQSLFLYLLEKREETELSVAVTTDNSVLLSEAERRGGPISPNTSRILLLAILAGLAIPAAISFLVDILNDKITTEEDIKRRTSVPILGSINFSKKPQQLVIKKGSRSSIAERFRLLRTNLQYIKLRDDKQLTLLVTSNASGEGKSFISLNLAASMALSGKKTLIIGLDLRKPKLKTYLNFSEDTKGMSNYLVGNANLEEVTHPIEGFDALDFIASGPIPPNPAELIMGEEMQSLLEKLKQEYQYIILDMPPLGLVTDAFLLSQQVDIALFAVRFKKTPKGMLNRLEELSNSRKFSRLGIVFNGIKAGGRYGGYRYGYGYGYGYGYYTED